MIRFISSLALCFARTSSQVMRTDDIYKQALNTATTVIESLLKTAVKYVTGLLVDVNRNIIKVLMHKRGQEMGKHSKNS